MAEPEKDPIEQAVELLLYAPVGLIYEYQNVIPQLVKRGKSQVQLARVIGKMAVDRQNIGIDASIEKAVEGLLGTAAQVLTDIGESIGLAPPTSSGSETSGSSNGSGDGAPADTSSADASGSESLGSGSLSKAVDSKSSASVKTQPKRLPIARYDELKAKEIIPLLDDLKPAQRSRVGEYERSNRARKTILAKIERLES